MNSTASPLMAMSLHREMHSSSGSLNINSTQAVSSLYVGNDNELTADGSLKAESIMK